MNEGLGVIGDEQLSPEARLELLREKLQFARRYLRVLPPSVRVEMDADPRVQATMAAIPQRGEHAFEERGVTNLIMGDDGEFHEMAIRPEDGLRPLSDAEFRALFPEDDETE